MPTRSAAFGRTVQTGQPVARLLQCHEALLYMPKKTLPPEILSAALLGLEAQRQRVESQIADVRRLIGAGAVPPAAKQRRSLRSRGKMSAAARKRIQEAQKKRWAAYHKAQEASPSKSAMVTKAPKKRRLSAAGRKAMV